MTNVVMVRSNKYNQINSVINISNSSKTYLVNTFFNMIDSLNIEINMQDVSSRGSENTSEGASTNQMDGHCPLVVKSCLIVIFYDFFFTGTFHAKLFVLLYLVLFFLTRIQLTIFSADRKPKNQNYLWWLPLKGFKVKPRRGPAITVEKNACASVCHPGHSYLWTANVRRLTRWRWRGFPGASMSVEYRTVKPQLHRGEQTSEFCAEIRQTRP